jgi:hypothetical protein
MTPTTVTDSTWFYIEAFDLTTPTSETGEWEMAEELAEAHSDWVNFSTPRVLAAMVRRFHSHKLRSGCDVFKLACYIVALVDPRFRAAYLSDLLDPDSQPDPPCRSRNLFGAPKRDHVIGGLRVPTWPSTMCGEWAIPYDAHLYAHRPGCASDG